MGQMEAMVRHYLHTEPAAGLDDLVEQYVQAVWIEERQTAVTAAAIAKALGG